MATKKKEEAVAVEETAQVQATETLDVSEVEGAKELDNKKYVVDRLLATKREGMEGLIEYMEEIGFFSAPCSGGNHLCCEFGLVHHTRNVMIAAENIGYALLGKVKYDEIRDSVIIAAALHDLGKCGDYGKQMYVPNILKSGKASEAKPYKRNPDLLPIDHATRSIKLATLFIDLTEDEEFAIRFHDGLYETANYGVKGNETPLYLILHYADLWSSRVTEGNEGEGGDE
jgi:23S rRNA maturation-related 3'-5' exoribonuclease YhaM